MSSQRTSVPGSALPGQVALADAMVLVVDDEPQMVAALDQVLRRHVARVTRAGSAAEALACLAREPIDAIVSDEHMPHMRGASLLAVAAREFPACTRIMLSGKATLDDAIVAINEGKVCRFLQKPLRPAQLLTALTEALQERGSVAAPAPSRAREADALAAGSFEQLSAREREVCALILDGLRVAHVATTLCISPQTVRNHLKSIFQKLGIGSQAELIDRARRIGR